MKRLLLAALLLAAFAAPAGAADVTVTQPAKNADAGANTGAMRERWHKMTPEQRQEMREKADRRLGERYDRLKPEEQQKINGILAEMDQLSKDEKSVLMGKLRQKAHEDHMNKMLLRDGQGAAPAAGTPPAPAPAKAPPAPAPVLAPTAPAAH